MLGGVDGDVSLDDSAVNSDSGAVLDDSDVACSLFGGWTVPPAVLTTDDSDVDTPSVPQDAKTRSATSEVGYLIVGASREASR